jgi:hypothetical protein
MRATIQEVMENYLWLGNKSSSCYAYIEVLTMEPVARGAGGYSYEGFDIWCRVLATDDEEGVKIARRDGSDDSDSYYAGDEFKWEFNPNSPALKVPWASEERLDTIEWKLVYPDEMPWCPKCDVEVIQAPDYLCDGCRYGTTGLELS